MTERFDAVVLGMGPGGEVAASNLLAAGKKVAVVERELIGGDCAYWACMPSKTLLRNCLVNPNGLHSEVSRDGKTRREAPYCRFCVTKNTRS